MGDGTHQPLDFAIPANPYFPAPEMYGELARHLDEHGPFRPRSTEELTARLAEVLGLPADTLALATGSAALITAIGGLLARGPAAAPVPSFSRWADPALLGAPIAGFPLREADGFALDPAAFARFAERRGARLAIVPDTADLGALLDPLAGLDAVVVDATGRTSGGSAAREAMTRGNVIAVRSMGETFGLHGIRLCYAVAQPALAARIRAALPRQCLTSVAGTVLYMLGKHRAAHEESLRRIATDRALLTGGLNGIPGVLAYPSEANVVLARFPRGVSAAGVRTALVARHGIVIRDCGAVPGLGDQFARLAVRPAAATHRLLAALVTELRRPASWIPAQPGAHHGWARTA